MDIMMKGLIAVIAIFIIFIVGGMTIYWAIRGCKCSKWENFVSWFLSSLILVPASLAILFTI